MTVITPLVWQQWEMELEDHPNKEWVQFLVRGIQQGFRVGELRRCRGNVCSASDPGVLGRGGGDRQGLESESRGRSQGALQPVRADPEEREAW